ncbi:MAG TPA: parallel beta-helix domain-containing protein [Chitinophagales bacterium]|jgi:parallel beta-helix repeat protein|nr:right-handed parallel beta-helix repeat-containing protein [Chitinophagales bacterium]MBP6153535.1 right-handed parallel beta-helix repeat-containing protein [Chitinophagales bacterium]HQV76937.1 parallel beta-helix domain-containing protein [Chitinophagales bacterium]HQW77996.1 parallel beta-helix domain-containing protein [Chitinophagales bacterium]HRB18497.1 parallel beta-helix domain-containing protein [Chitinophagales bacterium]
MRNSILFSFLLITFCLFQSCKNETKKAGDTKGFTYDEKIEKEFQEKLILVEDGGTVEFPAGKYLLKKTLSMEGKKNVTIKGAGTQKTILSFLGQNEGAEGINITNCQNVTMEGLTVQDAKGDNIKLKNCDGVALRYLNSTWTTGADTSNGNYGYYPVECRNVLVEYCEVSYCADAGVYVGQSTNVTIRHCYAHHNVAGIEIENCINSDVYKNKAENNAGGILIFDLPKLFQANGRNAKVWDNECLNNNFQNFGKPGSIVSAIPPGTGMIVMATDSVAIFNNKIKDNKTVGIATVSYLITGKQLNDSTYGPYCTSIFIHDNTFDRSGLSITQKVPDLSTDLGKLLTAAFKGGVDILVDGSADPKLRNKNGQLPEGKRICIRNNGNIKFGNLNAWKASGAKDIIKYKDEDISKFDCSILNINGNGLKPEDAK